jgi:hypothetical protein
MLVTPRIYTHIASYREISFGKIQTGFLFEYLCKAASEGVLQVTNFFGLAFIIVHQFSLHNCYCQMGNRQELLLYYPRFSQG